VGKEFNQGNQTVNVMQTAVFQDAERADYGDRASREAYTSGLDFQLLFHDRAWSVEGSAVGSIIAPEPLPDGPQTEPAKTYGTGGLLDVTKRGGKIRARPGLAGRPAGWISTTSAFSVLPMKSPPESGLATASNPPARDP